MRMRTYFFFMLFFCFHLNVYSTNQWLQQAISMYKQCAEQLKSCLPNIEVKQWLRTTRDTKIQHFHYHCAPSHIENTLKAFQQADTELARRLIFNSVTDGAVLGVLAACGSKLFKRERFDKKTIITAVIAALGWIAYQNNQCGVMPGYNQYNLQPINNVFANVSVGSFMRLVTMVFSGSCSYFASRFVLDKVAPLV